MTIKLGHFYMHKNCLDTCVRVLKISLDRTVIADWWNLGYTGNPWSLNDTKKFKLDENWIDITDKLVNVRTESGVPK